MTRQLRSPQHRQRGRAGETEAGEVCRERGVDQVAGVDAREGAMNDTQGTGLTRRTVLQAAGAAAAAYSLVGAAARTAGADDTPASTDKLVIHPLPSGVPTNLSYSVKAHTPGGDWQTVPVYRARAKQIDAK
jgi:hypothetical protein